MKLIDMLALQMEKSEVTIAPGSRYQTDLTVQDVIDMCGIPQNQQATAAYEFQNDQHVKIVNGKIFIPNCVELAKQAAFYRKQTRK